MYSALLYPIVSQLVLVLYMHIGGQLCTDVHLGISISPDCSSQDVLISRTTRLVLFSFLDLIVAGVNSAYLDP